MTEDDIVELVRACFKHPSELQALTFQQRVPDETAYATMPRTNLKNFVRAIERAAFLKAADLCTDPYHTPDGFGIVAADARCAALITQYAEKK